MKLVRCLRNGSGITPRARKLKIRFHSNEIFNNETLKSLESLTSSVMLVDYAVPPREP